MIWSIRRRCKEDHSQADQVRLIKMKGYADNPQDRKFCRYEIKMLYALQSKRLQQESYRRWAIFRFLSFLNVTLKKSGHSMICILNR